MNDAIRTARKALRKSERLWRLKCLTVFHDLYRSSLRQFSNLLRNTKSTYIANKVNECKSDLKALFCLIRGLTGQPRNLVLPVGPSNNAADFSSFFQSKVDKLRGSLLNDSEAVVPDPFSSDTPFSTYHTQEAQLMEFRPVSPGELLGIIDSSPVKSCCLDPIPTHLLKKIVTVLLPSLVILVNKSLSSGCFPESFKRASVTPLLKKSSLDPNILSNYRPVSGLPFLSKVIERVVL